MLLRCAVDIVLVRGCNHQTLPGLDMNEPVLSAELTQRFLRAELTKKVLCADEFMQELIMFRLRQEMVYEERVIPDESPIQRSARDAQWT